jgi:hypothetical protein
MGYPPGMVLDPPDEAVEDADTAAGDAAPAAPAAPDRWPDDDDPLPDGWAEVDLNPAPQRAGIDWSALELATARVLPAGLRMAGHTERVRVSLLGPRPLDARLSTADRRSRLHATLGEDPETGGVRLLVAGLDVSVHPRTEAGLLVVDAEVRLGDLRIPVVLALDPTPADPPVVLGADDLAGHVVVDPAGTHRLGEPE